MSTNNYLLIIDCEHNAVNRNKRLYERLSKYQEEVDKYNAIYDYTLGQF